MPLSPIFVYSRQFALALALVMPSCAVRAEITPTAPANEPSTWCRFVPERNAWENDRVAFRAYGPAIRGGAEDSGIDCWFKRVRTPIIDKWYAGERHGLSYHKDHGEGYDPYHVGGSRGCGGTALWRDEHLVTSGPYVAWRIIERSRKHSIFELDYIYPAEAGLPPIAETRRITILLGEFLFHTEARFTRAGKPAADLPVVIGLTTHNGKARVTPGPAQRWIAAWETIDGQGVGTGAVLGRGFTAETRDFKSPVKDQSHALLITRTNAAGVVAYSAGFCWEKAGQIRTAAEWFALLDACAQR